MKIIIINFEKRKEKEVTNHLVVVVSVVVVVGINLIQLLIFNFKQQHMNELMSQQNYINDNLYKC